MHIHRFEMRFGGTGGNARAAAFVLCASAMGLAANAAGQSHHHRLEVRAAAYSFAVKEPPGWFADSTIARQFDADLILYPAFGNPHSPGTPVMRVIAHDNTGDTAGAALNRQAEQYRSRHRNVKLGPATVTHRRYPASAKRFCVAAEFCDYVTWLEPGTGGKALVSIILHRPGRAAAAAELDAYRRLVSSME